MERNTPERVHSKQDAERYWRELRHWLLRVSILIPLASVIVVSITGAPNAAVSYLILVVWTVFSVAGLTFPDHAERIINVMMVTLIVGFFVSVMENGVLPVLILPGLVLLPSLLTQGWYRIVFTASPIAISLWLLTDPEPDTFRMLLRLNTASALIAVLVSQVTNKLRAEVRASNQQLQTFKALQEKQSQVYATVGHEIRTPAASIHMLAEEELLGHKHTRIEDIHKLSGHLLALIDDLRLLNRQASGTRLTTHDTSDNLYHMAERSIIGLSSLAESRGITVNLTADAATDQTFTGPYKSIQQIIQNLMRNAVLHSDGDEVTLSITQSYSSENRTHFVAMVTDNGRGISEVDQRSMFLPFERGSTTADGMGLGLFVCWELAQQLPAGSLRYETNYPHGSVFIFEFDLTTPVETNDSARGSGGVSLKQLRILLVEDTPVLRRLTGALLERQGASVILACDGKEALEILSTLRVDLVLTDIMMPNMDGFELVKTLRERNFIQPILGLTSATVGNEAAKLIQLGADEVLSKPLSEQQLELTLARLPEPRQLALRGTGG